MVVEVGGQGGDRLAARSVVVASGIQIEPRLPEVAEALPARLTALHALDYRAPASLPAGAVLVVGAGQTGGQISEDLLDAGRRVYLSPSRVPRLRRRHRGREVLDWLVPGFRTRHGCGFASR
jgi:putative flavoprotein involved in K+ transport